MWLSSSHQQFFHSRWLISPCTGCQGCLVLVSLLSNRPPFHQRCPDHRPSQAAITQPGLNPRHRASALSSLFRGDIWETLLHFFCWTTGPTPRFTSLQIILFLRLNSDFSLGFSVSPFLYPEVTSQSAWPIRYPLSPEPLKFISKSPDVILWWDVSLVCMKLLDWSLIPASTIKELKHIPNLLLFHGKILSLLCLSALVAFYMPQVTKHTVSALFKVWYPVLEYTVHI